jgi:hypothetical protein
MATYTIIGGDQKPYNLVTEDNIRTWIAEGRLNALSVMRGENDTEWRTLSEFPEFADALAASAAPPPPLAAASLPGSNAERAAALSRVEGPAIALIITAGLGVAYYTFNGLFTLLTGGMMFHQQLPPEVPPQLRTLIEELRASAPLFGIFNLMVAALNGFILFGAIRLLRLKNYTVVMIAAIAAMVPCQCCCLFGLPFGIWALVAMSKPEVKSQFT